MTDTVQKEGVAPFVGRVPLVVALAARFPRTGLALFAGFIILCTYLILPFLNLTEDPLAGLRLRDTQIARQSDAFIIGSRDARDFWREATGDGSSAPQVRQSRADECLYFLWMAPPKESPRNVFTPERLNHMAELEDAVVSLEGWQDVCRRDSETQECLPFDSVLSLIENSTDAVDTQEEIDERLEELWLTRRDKMKQFLTKEFYELDADGNRILSSMFTRSDICFGLPLAGYLNRGDRRDEQRKVINKWIQKSGLFDLLNDETRDSSEGLRFLYSQDFMDDIRSNAILEGDIMKIIFAILFILVVSSVFMRSVILAALGLLQVISSFPVAFFIYRFVLGIELMTSINFLSLFLVVGIGVDDLFLYVDAMKQSYKTALESGKLEDWTIEKRLSFAYKRAKFTMLVTTVTTGFSLFLLTISRIPAVRYFGIFAGLLVFVDFGLVITMFSCVLVLYEQYIRRPPSYSPSSVMSHVESQESTNPLAVEEEEELEEKDSSSETASQSPLELGRFATLLSDRRIALGIIGVFLLFSAIMIGFASQLTTSSSDENPFWDDEHYFSIFDDAVPGAFHDATRSSGEYFSLVAGLEKPFIDRSGISETDSEDLGAPVYNKDFDLSDEDAQEFFEKACRAAYRSELDLSLQGDKRPEDGAFCFMTAFRLWREARGETFPVVRPVPLEPVFEVPIPVTARDSESFDEALFEFLTRPGFDGFQQSVNFEYMGSSNLNGSALKLKFALHFWETSVDNEDPYRIRRVVGENWDKFIRQLREDVPSTIGAAEDVYYTEKNYFVLLEMQFLFLSNSFTSLGLALALAFGFLVVATNNLRLAVLAFSVMIGIVCSVLGFISAVGWSIDTIVALSVSILIGFTVDFSVHTIIAYDDGARERHLQSRLERTNHALMTVSVSVCAGGLTTLGGAIMLLPAEILFFRQFGAFLSMSVGISLAFALICLPAAMALFGPEGNEGLFSSFLEKRRHDGRLYHIENHVGRDNATIKRLSKSLAALWLLIFLLVILLFDLRTGSFFVKFRENEDEEAPSIWEDSNSGELPNIEILPFGFWERIIPERGTSCARGEPYAFFFKRGTSDTLIIEFEGGGGVCWTEKLCKPEEGFIRDSTSFTEARLTDIVIGAKNLEGIANQFGPFGEASHLFIPICTGDAGLGNRTTQYSDEVVINHFGFVNSFSAIEWVLNQFEAVNANKIITTGTQYGGLASLVYSFLVAGWLEIAGLDDEVRLLQFGDSSMGIYAPAFYEQALEAWGAVFSFNETTIVFNDEFFSISSQFSPLFEVGGGNLTAFGECLGNANETGVAFGDLADFLLQIDSSSTLQECADEFNVTDLLAFETGSQVGNLTEDVLGNSTAGNFTDFANMTGFNSVELESLFAEQCNGTQSELLEGLCGGLNVTTPTDIVQSLQVVPTLYLLASYRFPIHEWMQYSSGYDHVAARDLVVQFIGEPLRGVSFAEKELFYALLAATYDSSREIRPPNYHVFIDNGDKHNHLNSDFRFFQALRGQLYQIVYGLSTGLDISVAGLLSEYDCADEISCQLGVDTRATDEIALI